MCVCVCVFIAPPNVCSVWRWTYKKEGLWEAYLCLTPTCTPPYPHVLPLINAYFSYPHVPPLSTVLPLINAYSSYPHVLPFIYTYSPLSTRTPPYQHVPPLYPNVPPLHLHIIALIHSYPPYQRVPALSTRTPPYSHVLLPINTYSPLVARTPTCPHVPPLSTRTPPYSHHNWQYWLYWANSFNSSGVSIFESMSPLRSRCMPLPCVTLPLPHNGVFWLRSNLINTHICGKRVWLLYLDLCR